MFDADLLPLGRRHPLRRSWPSARGFWRGPTARLAWSLITLLVMVTVLQLLVQYLLNLWGRDFFNALEFPKAGGAGTKKGVISGRHWETVEGTMTMPLAERYADRLAGVLSCYDRIVVTGTLPTVCYADGMTRFLYAKGIRIFDYPDFAMALRERVREVAARLAATAGVEIEHISKSHIRKEAVVAKVLEKRGDHPGLVHVISAMEACSAYKPWHDKATHKTYLRPDSGKCLHYYFYFMDRELGLVYLRVPTWAPFRLQFYCNGHSWLARRLTAAGIGFTPADNAFVRIDDWSRAQALADQLSPDRLRRVLDRYARQCCPVLDAFDQSYHWSLMQVEYSTDLVFRSTTTLAPLYEQLARQSVLSVKAEQVATFLGRKITPLLAQEIGSQFSTRIEGTCIKHRFGSASIKMYDKLGLHPAHRDHDQ